MGSRRSWLTHCKRGNALVEFGLIMPVLVTMMGTAADFGLSLWTRSQLASAMSHATQYAYVVGPTITATALQNAVIDAARLPVAPSVSVSGPSWYCTSGTPVTASAGTQGTKCGNGQYPGQYVTINATSTYVPLFPFYAQLSSTSTAVVESAIIRLQ